MEERREEEQQHHPAVDNLVSLFTKANRDLSLIHLKLDSKFHQIYPDNANPMKLVARIKKIEDEMSALKDQCRQLLAAKQDLIDKASSVSVCNKSMLQRMQALVGVPMTRDSKDAAYSSFIEIIEEWTTLVGGSGGKGIKRKHILLMEESIGSNFDSHRIVQKNGNVIDDVKETFKCCEIRKERIPVSSQSFTALTERESSGDTNSSIANYRRVKDFDKMEEDVYHDVLCNLLKDGHISADKAMKALIWLPTWVRDEDNSYNVLLRALIDGKNNVSELIALIDHYIEPAPPLIRHCTSQQK